MPATGRDRRSIVTRNGARLSYTVDRILSTREEVEYARQKAVDVHFRHGALGVDTLRTQLASERRVRFRRCLRLAIGILSRPRGRIPD